MVIEVCCSSFSFTLSDKEFEPPKKNMKIKSEHKRTHTYINSFFGNEYSTTELKQQKNQYLVWLCLQQLKKFTWRDIFHRWIQF